MNVLDNKQQLGLVPSFLKRYLTSSKNIRFVLYLLIFLLIARLYAGSSSWTYDTGKSLVEQQQEEQQPMPKLGELKCHRYGGPSDQTTVREMIYWRDIPQDREWKSPFKTKQRKYLSVEVDAGGFNNIRMTVEIAMALAHATGRTFVLPPQHGIYLLDKTYTLHDFYNLEGMDVISMKDFLETEVMTGNLRNEKGQSVLPPNNRTDWTGHFSRRESIWEDSNRTLDHFLRTLGTSPKFKPSDKVIFVPRKPNLQPGKSLDQWEQYAYDLWVAEDTDLRRSGEKYFGAPTPVNAEAEQRFEEVFADRRVWPYNQSLEEAPLIHFMTDDDKGIRMHGLFYYALFFEDWKTDLVVKRYVRDKLRYRDEVFCAAARIVERVREFSRRLGNPQGDFYTYHVRRNDFAHIGLVKTGHTLYWNTHELVPPNATVYIATDEQDKSWFDPLVKQFGRVYFLDDFRHLLGDDMDSSLYGMVDQIVAARGKVFVGAYYSTMTSFIMTMRGYYSQVEKTPGWEMGILDSYYYAPKERMNFFRHYQPLQGEVPSPADAVFPMAWRDIDKPYDAH